MQARGAETAACELCWWFPPDEVGVVAYEYYNWARYWLGVRLPAEAPPADGCQATDTT